MANTKKFDNFKIVAIEVESILLEPGFISVSENRRIALAIPYSLYRMTYRLYVII